jgi:hypothetical protein
MVQKSNVLMPCMRGVGLMASYAQVVAIISTVGLPLESFSNAMVATTKRR